MKPASFSTTKPCIRLVLTALAGACSVFAQLGAFAQYAYVANYAGGVSVVNGTTGTVIGSPIALTGPLTGLALAGGQLYVAQSGADRVAVINTASNNPLTANNPPAPITIPVGNAPLACGYADRTNGIRSEQPIQHRFRHQHGVPNRDGYHTGRRGSDVAGNCAGR